MPDRVLVMGRPGYPHHRPSLPGGDSAGWDSTRAEATQGTVVRVGERRRGGLRLMVCVPHCHCIQISTWYIFITNIVYSKHYIVSIKFIVVDCLSKTQADRAIFFSSFFFWFSMFCDIADIKNTHHFHIFRCKYWL